MITGIELVQQVIRKQVTGVPVVSKVPADRPDLFIRVDGSAPTRAFPAFDRVRIIVWVYGVDQEQVIQLCQQLREICIDVAAFHPQAMGWEEESGAFDYPDTSLEGVFRWNFSGILFMAIPTEGLPFLM